jgi:hypothetical protein
MKRVVILTVSILAIGFLSTAFNPVPKAGTDLSNNVEALLAEEIDPIGQTCTEGCKGTVEFSVCVMCRQCTVMFFIEALGSRGTCGGGVQ